MSKYKSLPLLATFALLFIYTVYGAFKIVLDKRVIEEKQKENEYQVNQMTKELNRQADSIEAKQHKVGLFGALGE